MSGWNIVPRAICIIPGVVVVGADPDLLATLCFLSFSVNIDRMDVKF